MFREGSLISGVAIFVLAAALLACPCGMLAQHGGGGGHMGGGTAGGGGLSGGGRATGLDVKDDLKDFHAALAVQATSRQIVEYDLMLKSTASTATELQAFQEQLGKQAKGSELASSGITLNHIAIALNQALERARTENNKFLDGFSEQQKSGLKEITKRLIKADSELAQQAIAFNEQVGDAKAVGPQIAGFAQSLERALTGFRGEQLDLGEEMSIGVPSNREGFALNIPPVKNLINFASQPISIITSGVISKGAAAGQNTFKLELTADMSDLQQNITEILRAELDKSDRCGERIAIQTAALTPQAPASLVVAKVHYERWACFGRDTINEMVEGNATVEVKLTPAVGEGGTLRFVPEMGRVVAEGLVGELLRSGSLGDTLRDSIAESLLPSLRQGADYKAMLPPAARGDITLHRARFQGTGLGKLSVVLEGEIQVASDKVSLLTGESNNGGSKAGELKTDGSKTSTSKGQSSPQESLPQ